MITIRINRVVAIVVLLAVLFVLTVGWSVAESGVIKACVKERTGKIRIVGPEQECRRKETPISWNRQGPQGLQGEPGPQGDPGPPGLSGKPALVTHETGWVNHLPVSQGSYAAISGFSFPVTTSVDNSVVSCTLNAHSQEINGSKTTYLVLKFYYDETPFYATTQPKIDGGFHSYAGDGWHDVSMTQTVAIPTAGSHTISVRYQSSSQWDLNGALIQCLVY